VNALDFAVLIAAAAAGVGGWRQGLLVRVVTSIAAVGGVLLCARNVDWIAERLPGASSTPRLLGVLAALVIGWVGGRLVGGIAGRWLRDRIPTKTLQRTDQLAGLGVGVVGVGITLWLAAPVMFLLPGWPSTAAQDSKIISTLRTSVGLAPLPIDTDLWPQVPKLDGLRFPRSTLPSLPGVPVPTFPVLPTLPNS
jgi:hypothetical protein